MKEGAGRRKEGEEDKRMREDAEGRGGRRRVEGRSRRK